MIGSLRIIRYGIQGFRRNLLFSAVAIITMMFTLLTMTFFAVGEMSMQRYTAYLNTRFDFTVYLRDEPSEEQVQLFKKRLEARDEVVTISYSDKNAVLTSFQERNAGREDLLVGLTAESNPFARELVMKLEDPSQISSMNEFVRGDSFKEFVEDTSDGSLEVTVNSYLNLVRFVRFLSFAFTVFFLLIVTVILFNTIRLIIVARKDEIEIMRLVGATSAFVRGPFLVEGAIVGLAGALITALVTYIILIQAQLLVNQAVTGGSQNAVVFQQVLSYITNQDDFSRLFSNLVGMQIFVGLLLGLACSALAVRRYLRDH